MTNKTTPVAPPSKPTETSPISIQGHLKVYDPNTKEVFIDKRA